MANVDEFLSAARMGDSNVPVQSNTDASASQNFGDHVACNDVSRQGSDNVTRLEHPSGALMHRIMFEADVDPLVMADFETVASLFFHVSNGEQSPRLAEWTREQEARQRRFKYERENRIDPMHCCDFVEVTRRGCKFYLPPRDASRRSFHRRFYPTETHTEPHTRSVPASEAASNATRGVKRERQEMQEVWVSAIKCLVPADAVTPFGFDGQCRCVLTSDRTCWVQCLRCKIVRTWVCSFWRCGCHFDNSGLVSDICQNCLDSQETVFAKSEFHVQPRSVTAFSNFPVKFKKE